MKTNIPALQAIYQKEVDKDTHTKQIIALTMRAFDCTYSEIGEVLGITRQGAESIVKSSKYNLN